MATRRMARVNGAGTRVRIPKNRVVSANDQESAFCPERNLVRCTPA